MPNPFEGPPGKPELGMIKCPKCGGSGKADGKTCSKCGGKGEIRAS
jgi:DnaJ-class molecular chaperone